MARTKKRYRLEAEEKRLSTTYQAGIYVRLSKERTENWRNKSQSIGTQESLAKTFAKENGLAVVKTYIDYEYSGTQFDRPAFQEMMEDIKKGTINCIMIRDLSRLGRDYIEMGRLIDKVFPFLGVRFISINDHLDTLHGLEEKKSFEVEIKNLVNDLYSKDISKKVTSYVIHQASQGYFIGRFAPYGYQLEKLEGGKKLIIDPVVKHILHSIFEQLLEGKSVAQVTSYLNQSKVAIPTTYRYTGQVYRSDTDAPQWRSSTLLRLIQNPIYQGHLVQRRTNKQLTEADFIRVEQAHEAYISQTEFEKILSALHSRRSVKKRTEPKTPNRYKGLIYAAGNSKQMYRYCRHFSNRKSDYDYYYFMDYVNNPHKSEKQTVYISEVALDMIIAKLLQDEMTRFGTLEELLPRLQATKEERQNDYQQRIKQHRQAISSLQSDLSGLYASYRLSGLDKEKYLTEKSERQAKIRTLSQEMINCEQAIGKVEEEFQHQVVWLKALAGCQQIELITSDLLTAVIERIEVSVDKEVTVTFTCQMGGDWDV
ncbi:recombinase family protein [Streptococcus sp. ZY19097]|uniref:recombinase family protein n=1 Tax=Streptococcus sp. ZY19097 TaxID=3231906 RepID=UPI00345AB038